MRHIIITLLLAIPLAISAQVEPEAGNWKTWFIESGKTFRLSKPADRSSELAQVIAAQQSIDATRKQKILYWNAGSPGYRWIEMMGGLWIMDTSYNGMLANMLLSTSIYDATIAAWDSKYAYPVKRPFEMDQRVKRLIPAPESPSYPCEFSVAAGAAVTVISHFYPKMKDSVQKMANELMATRVAAGVSFPSDTREGFELGRRIAEKEIAFTKDFTPRGPWDGKMPQQPGVWRGPRPMFPMAGLAKTIILESGNEFRPPAPPDFAKDMDELKKFKPNFRTNANAYLHASQAVLNDLLNEKMFEYNLHLNPPRSARIYAYYAVGTYDGFISCWDAKYAYWGIRPNQYDTAYKSLVGTPPFPGYPSGHAMLSSVQAELLSYFFPAEAALFRKTANDVAESRFHAGIHFRTDNVTANEMGKQVAAKIISKIRTEGID